MFLVFLNPKLKDNFLELCVHAALANGVFAEQQMRAFEAYCKELEVEPYIPVAKNSLDELYKKILENSSVVERNIIIVELLSFIISDGDIDNDEREMLDKLSSVLGVTKEKLENFIGQVTRYRDLAQEIFTSIVK